MEKPARLPPIDQGELPGFAPAFRHGPATRERVDSTVKERVYKEIKVSGNKKTQMWSQWLCVCHEHFLELWGFISTWRKRWRLSRLHATSWHAWILHDSHLSCCNSPWIGIQNPLHNKNNHLLQGLSRATSPFLRKDQWNPPSLAIYV